MKLAGAAAGGKDGGARAPERGVGGAGVMTRILIADDHEVVRRGVRAILEARPSR